MHEDTIGLMGLGNLHVVVVSTNGLSHDHTIGTRYDVKLTEGW